jgi:hypothetical protein
MVVNAGYPFDFNDFSPTVANLQVTGSILGQQRRHRNGRS